MSCHKHLTLLEREKLALALAKGQRISQIAKELCIDRSTVYRELKRNTSHGEYLPALAQKAYQKRRLRCRRKKVLADCALYLRVARLFLDLQWSPQQIASRLRLEGTGRISYATIYRAIHAGIFDFLVQPDGHCSANRKLRHRGKSRHTKNYEEKRGRMAISHSIEERPKEAEERSRVGDWEADTVIGQKGKACLVTLVDRKTRFLLCRKADRKTADCVTDVMIASLRSMPLHSITPDRGKEFSNHAAVTAALDVEFYFALPRHPWQRGTNENTNGLLREYFPKSQDFSGLSDAYIQAQVDKLNLRPRKCLSYLSPYEAFFSKVLHLT